ncbi:hypothetical protein ACZ87_02061 [Candidatus Erwinia dacicola]|uniref:Uncharacterized protein n=1 Tax=Candidatus Erwinia dacicola TaxID=252393 RepID=A0A328TKI1_9GAMM|nr:hypothetical protein ACZ87_02061 [Candidatus Erwinia dacicola]
MLSTTLLFSSFAVLSQDLEGDMLKGGLRTVQINHKKFR